jgi:hypothetical protein
MLLVSTLLSISNHLSIYLPCLLLAALVGCGLNYVLLKRLVSGLFSLQVSFTFNTAVVLFGWATGAISCSRVAHFFFYEGTVVVGIYWVYRRILDNRADIFQRLRQADPAAVSSVLVAFNLLLFGLYVVVVQNDGTSRIEFMTATWFSFLRPVLSLLTPLTFFFPFYLLERGERFRPLSILGSAILSSIASGSKGTFAFGCVGSLLFYQELKGSRFVIPRALRFVLFAALSLSAVFALQRLDVGMADLADRFVRFGESTIMVYYAPDPSAAAAGVSTLAKIHRGGARLLGDRSAADIDTLFGFALSREDHGDHNFTGPNAQVASYMLANYSGWDNLIGVSSILAYLAIVTWFYRAFIHHHGNGKVLLLPFVIASLNAFPQDYYQGMSDVTVISMAVLALAGMGVVTYACSGAGIRGVRTGGTRTSDGTA